jgi:hypothetical protein
MSNVYTVKLFLDYVHLSFNHLIVYKILFI